MAMTEHEKNLVAYAKGVLTASSIMKIAVIAIICFGLGLLGTFLVDSYIINNDTHDDDDPSYISDPAESPDSDEPAPTPDLTSDTDEPTPTPNPTPDIQATPEPDLWELLKGTWFYAYMEFVLNEEYARLINDRPSGGDGMPIVLLHFMLHDLDADGIPELLIKTDTGFGGDGAGSSVLHVFTYDSGNVVRIGMDYQLTDLVFTAHEFGLSGLFEVNLGWGDYWVSYLEVVDGNYSSTLVFSGNAQDHYDNGNYTFTYVETRRTPNSALYDAFMASGADLYPDYTYKEDNLIKSYTLDEIHDIGWEEFVLRVYWSLLPG
jgi:hypothetical protein